jgi:hypothetical protein
MKQYTVSLYGWDLNAQWHGPDEIEVGAATALVRKLRPRTGWYSGQLCCCDDLQMNVHAAVRDLGDAVIAILDFPDSPGAPAQVLAIVAAHRRARVPPSLPSTSHAIWRCWTPSVEERNSPFTKASNRP